MSTVRILVVVATKHEVPLAMIDVTGALHTNLCPSFCRLASPVGGLSEARPGLSSSTCGRKTLDPLAPHITTSTVPTLRHLEFRSELHPHIDVWHPASALPGASPTHGLNTTTLLPFARFRITGQYALSASSRFEHVFETEVGGGFRLRLRLRL